MIDKTTGIVFLHGAGLNSTIWDALRSEIDVPMLTIDFPNRNTRDNANSKLTFTDYVHTTAEQVKNWNCRNLIMVAHSIGACAGLKAAQLFTNELKGFVAISSVIPKNGNSFASTLPFPQKLILPAVLHLFGTRPPQKIIENELCNDLTDEQTRLIVNAFTPESKALYTTKIDYDLPESKRLYIKLTNDKSIPAELQEKMAKNLKAHQVISLHSGHLPMISHPGPLADILSGFIKDIEQDDQLSNTNEPFL
jgi:pimeloyl-ACP methyl ester carboxylesterase